MSASPDWQSNSRFKGASDVSFGIAISSSRWTVLPVLAGIASRAYTSSFVIKIGDL